MLGHAISARHAGLICCCVLTWCLYLPEPSPFLPCDLQMFCGLFSFFLPLYCREREGQREREEGREMREWGGGCSEVHLA